MKIWLRTCIIIFIIVFLIIGVPIIINEAYKTPNGYITLWDAKDVLQYYGGILGAMAAVLAILASIFIAKSTAKAEIEKNRLIIEHNEIIAIVNHIKDVLLLNPVEQTPTSILNLIAINTPAKSVLKEINIILVKEWPKIKNTIDTNDDAQNQYHDKTVSILSGIIKKFQRYQALVERFEKENKEYEERKKAFEDSITQEQRIIAKAAKKKIEFSEERPITTSELYSEMFQKLEEDRDRYQNEYQKIVEKFIQRKNDKLDDKIRNLYKWWI